VIPFNRRFLFISALFLLSCRAVPQPATREPWFGGVPSVQAVDIQLPRTIKVSLVRARRTVMIGSTGRYAYSALKKDAHIEVGPNTTLKVTGIKGGMMIGRKKYTSMVRVTPLDPESRLTVNKRAYRGYFLLKPTGGGGVHVIEEVGLEDYLYGVLPREVGADWPIESLKAQAVVSRTYVLANIRRATGKGYDVTNDVYSQVYGGLKDEHPETNEAVRATRNEILIDPEGQPVLTFFHSSCGGRTDNAHLVWQELKNPPDYLDGVKDPYCREDPFNHWTYQISAENLQRRLRRKGYRVGLPTKISAARTSPSGRTSVFLVESSRGRMQIPGNSFRLAIGPEQLRSTFLTEMKRKGKSFYFEGQGWGHGVGMCQWGARGRAQEGHSYTKIIEAYYPGVRLVKASGPDAP
jgi:stage II sporulation protein D